MLLGTLVASLLGNMLTGKQIIRAEYGSKDLPFNKGKEIVRAGMVLKIFNSAASFN